jgi:rare lipoprotein A
MDGKANNTPRMARRALILAAAMTLPAGTSALADDGSVRTREAFSAAFAPMNVAAAAFVPTPGMVDITTIDPADEPEADETVTEGRSLGRGVASYYAGKFNGRRTASGETFSNHLLTAAHRTLPFGTRLLVTNPANGRQVVVRVNDRGPFTAGRSLDLSRAAAEKVGIVQRGHGTVELAVVD